MAIRTSPPAIPARRPEIPGILLPSTAPMKLMAKVVQPMRMQLGNSRISSMKAKETPTASASMLVATAIIRSRE